MKKSSVVLMTALLFAGIPAIGKQTISNYADGEVVRYPLVLLRGDLSDDALDAITVINESSKKDSRTMQGVASQGRFKAFAELVPGENRLLLKAGADKFRLMLKYIPQTNPYKVRAVHFTDKSGDPVFESQFKDDPQNYRAKWDAALKLMQTFTADWMQARGYGRKTFNLELDAQGQVIVHIVRGKGSFEEMQKLNGYEAYSAAAAAIAEQLPPGPFKNLVTVAWSRHNPETGMASGYAALGGGGVATMGGACFYTWPTGVADIQKTFMSDVQIDTKNFHADGGNAIYRTSGNTIGAALHELGHAFGLPHTDPAKGLGNALMHHGYLISRYATLMDPPWEGNGQRWVPFDEEEERKSIYIAEVSAAALASTRALALDARDYTEENTIAFGIDQTTRELVVSSRDGISFAGVEIPGAAERFKQPAAGAPPPPEIRFALPQIAADYGTDELTVRVVDAMGHYRHTTLSSLLHSEENLITDKPVSAPAKSRPGPQVSKSAAAESDTLSLIPWPAEVKQMKGRLALGPNSRIVYGTPELEPLAKVLATEIESMTRLKLATSRGGSGRAGDILLRVDSRSDESAYRLEIDSAARVTGGGVQSVAYGSVTLLQALSGEGRKTSLPRMRVADHPARPYRGAMIDLARKYHSPEGIRQVIDLCRFYKINYLHLHLSDDHLFMFPSKAFPELGRGNHEFARFDPPSAPAPIRPYTRQTLIDLDLYARARGVMLVPEIDMPGHASRLLQDAPDAFGAEQDTGNVINFTGQQTLKAAETLLNELMDVFATTPYIHLGADEVDLGPTASLPGVKALMAAEKCTVHDLYNRFIQQLNAMVNARGKRAIVWHEAYTRPGARFPLPKNAVLMYWQGHVDLAGMLRDGYQVVNACWVPLYIVRSNKHSPEVIYNQWSVHRTGLVQGDGIQWRDAPESELLLGGQMCSWENSESIEIASLRERLAAVASRTWNPASGLDYLSFKERLVQTDAKLEALVHPVRISVDATLTVDESTSVSPSVITLTPARADIGAGATIRYTLDNTAPAADSTLYSAPFTVNKEFWLQAALFDATGRRLGAAAGRWVDRLVKFEKNLATGKPVTAHSSDPGYGPEIAVDGKTEINQHWASKWSKEVTPFLTVDLEGAQSIARINVLTYYDGSRFYQFTVDVSEDGQRWKQVADLSQNRGVATAEGYQVEMDPPVTARYVRVNMLRNSANEGVHIVELMVFAPTK